MLHRNSACLSVCACGCVCFLLPFSSSSNFSSSTGELPKENPYEDVELKSRRAGRKSQQLSENSLDSLHRMWSPQDRKYNSPPSQVTAASTWACRFGTRATVPSRLRPASPRALSLTSAWQRRWPQERALPSDLCRVMILVDNRDISGTSCPTLFPSLLEL